ncbi:MAG TPA: response regulator [Flavisolibacter sp.]|jgi:DNA-binding LytR/AlgR family response regulator|nr:response regulator [Flavisolibacter sp.]
MNERKITCLAVDDEPPALEVLKKFINSVQRLELVGTCLDAVEAINFLQTNPVDLIFLDIKMPELLGTDLIRALQNPPKVIFTTAFRKYAVEGFELDAVDYLLKPISFDRFLKAVNKVLQLNIMVPHPFSEINEQPKEPANAFMYFRVNRKMEKIFFDDILFIEALKDYIKIVTPSRTFVTKYVLSELEDVLPTGRFLRIHKSYVISIDKIESFNTGIIQIQKQELPIGRMYKFDVARSLNASQKFN